jgi:hypothetical protein
MSEIEMVVGMQDNRFIKKREDHVLHRSKESGSSSRPSDQNTIIQIKTTTDGYNSGRIYYLRPLTNDDTQCTEIIEKLRACAHAARTRGLVLSRFKRMQRAARRIHDSPAFQTCVATLICVVTPPPPPPDPSSHKN